MAEELNVSHWVSLFGLVVPIIAASITGWFAYRIGARKEAGTTQAALHSGFKILIDDLQAERDRLATQLSRVIDEGNLELKLEIKQRFAAVEAKIEHNRRNADHNFGIINEIMGQQIADAVVQGPGQTKAKRKVKVFPQRLPPET